MPVEHNEVKDVKPKHINVDEPKPTKEQEQLNNQDGKDDFKKRGY